MIHRIPSADRFRNNAGWLDARWHFSFDSYHEPNNTHWGALRVFNDDVIQAGQGFGMHPHRDMEIITCVLDGALEHQDSLGGKGVIRPGELQVMSAGTGIYHSERNHSTTEPLRLMQIWIFPEHKGLKPRWEQKTFTPEQQAGKLLPVVSSVEKPVNGTLTIDQDATVYLSRLGEGESVRHTTQPDRKPYLFLISGKAVVNGVNLDAGDQARVTGEKELHIASGNGKAEFILLDLPA
jgi:redox-sensitive bicupin YhaK (pirin superfamily)